MLSSAASHELLEFGPLVSNLVAAGPALLEIVEDGLARVELALGAVVVHVGVALATALAGTFLGGLPCVFDH